jgi:hypothetical protein
VNNYFDYYKLIFLKVIKKIQYLDVTWTKGAKRQMANLDRFIEELQSFDQHELTENTIKLLQDFDKKIDSYESSETGLHTDALNTLHRWTKGVLKYNSLMIQRVKPLHEKVDQIEQDVKEADQKLTALNRKSEALNARLKDLAQNFEEATVDKEEQQENVSKMQKQLQTASDLNIVIAIKYPLIFRIIFFIIINYRYYHVNSIEICKFTKVYKKEYYVFQLHVHWQADF